MNQKLQTLYNIELFDSNGNLKEKKSAPNSVTNEGLRFALDLMFMNKDSFGTLNSKYSSDKKNGVVFYVGLMSGFPTENPTKLADILKYTSGTDFDIEHEFLDYKVKVVTIDGDNSSISDLTGERSELYINKRSSDMSTNLSQYTSNYCVISGSICDTRRSFTFLSGTTIKGLFLANKKEHPVKTYSNTNVHIGYNYSISDSEKLYGYVDLTGSPITASANDVLYVTLKLSASNGP